MTIASFSKNASLLKSIIVICCLSFTLLLNATAQPFSDDRFTGFVVDSKKQNIGFFWKDDGGVLISGFENLKQHLKSKGSELVFAMNGGMYQRDYSPVGLFIDKGKTLFKLNKKSGEANFYLKPNGVFYLTSDRMANVVITEKFKASSKVQYATQSGPMLVIDHVIHPSFRKGSENLNIRNGVGILPDGKVLMAISKVPVNLYDFALYFKNAGCKNALYLDGFVSRIYDPSRNILSGDEKFGVMIGVYK